MSKTRITIWLDDEILDFFRKKFPARYQSSINDALRAHVARAGVEDAVHEYFSGDELKEMVREAVREELQESQKIPTTRPKRAGVKKKG